MKQRKVILEFYLPLQENELFAALNGIGWMEAFANVRNVLRRWKHDGHRFTSADNAINATIAMCHREMNERGLTFRNGGEK